MRPIVRLSVLLLVLAAALEAVAADELGTLFTTPEERARLDKLRRGEPSAAARAATDPMPSRHKPALTGYVQRSDGRATIWIDGRPVVVATPGAAPLEPSMVQPLSSDRVIRIDQDAKPEDTKR